MTIATTATRSCCSSPSGGRPSVYYGDEFGLRGVKEERVGGADTLLVSLNLGDIALASRPMTEVLAAREAQVSGNSLEVGTHGWAIALLEESTLRP